MYLCVLIGMRSHSYVNDVSILENKGLISYAGEVLPRRRLFFYHKQVHAPHKILSDLQPRRSVYQPFKVHRPAHMAVDQGLAQQHGVICNPRGRRDAQHAFQCPGIKVAHFVAAPL